MESIHTDVYWKQKVELEIRSPHLKIKGKSNTSTSLKKTNVIFCQDSLTKEDLLTKLSDAKSLGLSKDEFFCLLDIEDKIAKLRERIEFKVISKWMVLSHSYVGTRHAISIYLSILYTPEDSNVDFNNALPFFPMYAAQQQYKCTLAL